MVLELEDAALRLFEQRGFGEVTVDDIASEAKISARTFYRYFPAKEDVLQLRIEKRSEALRAALAARPDNEPLLQSLRLAYEEELSAEDMAVLRRWVVVVAATPGVLRSVVGGIQLKSHRVMAEFFSSRLDLPADALVPTVLAAATGGVIQAAHTSWFLHGGDLTTKISESLEVLEKGIGTDPRAWSAHNTAPKGPARNKPVNPRKRGRYGTAPTPPDG